MAAGADFGRYRADEMLRSAAERHLEPLMAQLRPLLPSP